MLHYSLVDAKKRGQTLIAQKDQKKVYLHSRIDPYKEAKDQVQNFLAKINIQDISSIIILGLAAGYHVSELVEHIPQSCPILIIEKEIQIADLCPADIARCCQLLVQPDSSDLEKTIQDLPTSHCQIFLHRASRDLFPEYYESLWKEIQGLVSHKDINTATLSRFDQLWLHNFSQNLPLLFTSSKMKNILPQTKTNPAKGLDAILVGGGPTLNEQLSSLQKIQNSVFIAAVDTALKPLLDYNIQPDIVFTVDAQFINALYLVNNPAHIPLAAEPTTHPASLRHWPGPIFFFSSPFSYNIWLEKFIGTLGVLKHGGSVSTNAFDFLCQCGFDHIFLVGQDMAFAHKRAHASGTILDEIRYSQSHRTQSRENFLHHQLTALPPLTFAANNGSTVQTNHKLHYFKKWFDQEINKAPSPVINCAGHGLPLEGSTYGPLPEPKNSAKKEHPFLQNFIFICSQSQQKQQPSEQNQFENFLLELTDLLETIPPLLTILAQGQETAQEIQRLAKYQKYPKSQMDSRVRRKLQELDDLDSKINEYQKSSEVLSPVMQRAIQPVLSGSKEHLSEEQKNDPLTANAVTTEKLYQGMSEALVFSLQSLNKGKLLLNQLKKMKQP